MSLLSVPLLNQLSGNDDNDRANQYNECGPTSVRMLFLYYGLDESVLDITTEATSDPYWHGYTYTYQLASVLNDKNLHAVQVQSNDVVSAAKQALRNGYPVIYLRYWNLAAKTGGHFCVLVGDPDGDAYLNNPWGGVLDHWTWDQVAENSLGGWLIIVQKAKSDVDPKLYQEAVTYYQSFNVACNPDTALFKAWLRWYLFYASNGYDKMLNPTPPKTTEVVDATTGDAYQVLDSGVILHYRKDKADVFQLELGERKDVLTKYFSAIAA